MNQYYIHEANIERLEKKLATIEKKCSKTQTAFTYHRIGEEFREVEVDGVKQIHKYYLVEAEGTAKYNGWRFIAVIDHRPEGNIIRNATEIEFPKKYYTTDSVCEHCNSRRHRKETYLVRNEETGEWKQVGSSCLKEFTNGLDAENVARYISYFDELIHGEAVPQSASARPFFPTDMVLAYTAEVCDIFGYANSESAYPTKERVYSYTQYFEYNTPASKRVLEDISKYSITKPDARCYEVAKKAINWAKNVSADNNYLHNIKTLASSAYVDTKDFGFVCSIIPAYIREEKHAREEAARKAVHEEQVATCKHVGEIGKRYAFKVQEAKIVASWDTQWGLTFLYRFVDTDNNILTWTTSNYFEPEKMVEVTGTVKAHTEYRDVAQTELTRCKVVEAA